MNDKVLEFISHTFPSPTKYLSIHQPPSNTDGFYWKEDKTGETLYLYKYVWLFEKLFVFCLKQNKWYNEKPDRE